MERARLASPQPSQMWRASNFALNILSLSDIFSHIRPTHLTAASEKIFHFTSQLADTASSVPLTNLTILFCIFPRSVFKLFNLITHSRRSIISTSCWRKGKSRILALMIKAEECLFLTPYFPTTLI